MADFGEIAVRKVIASDTAWACFGSCFGGGSGLGGGRPLPWTLDQNTRKEGVLLAAENVSHVED